MSDLKLQLRDFKRSVRESDVLNPTIGVIGVWLPFFTSDFKEFLGLDAQLVKMIYFVIALCLMLMLIRNIVKTGYILIRRLIALRANEELPSKYVNDPDKLADLLCKSDAYEQ